MKKKIIIILLLILCIFSLSSVQASISEDVIKSYIDNIPKTLNINGLDTYINNQNINASTIANEINTYLSSVNYSNLTYDNLSALVSCSKSSLDGVSNTWVSVYCDFFFSNNTVSNGYDDLSYISINQANSWNPVNVSVYNTNDKIIHAKYSFNFVPQQTQRNTQISTPWHIVTSGNIASTGNNYTFSGSNGVQSYSWIVPQVNTFYIKLSNQTSFAPFIMSNDRIDYYSESLPDEPDEPDIPGGNAGTITQPSRRQTAVVLILHRLLILLIKLIIQ